MPHTLYNSFGQPFIIITPDVQNGWVYNDWRGMLSVESVVQGAEAILRVMRDHQLRYLLNDNRAVIGSWNQANDWIAAVWMPQALDLGLRGIAHVVPPATFVAASAEEMRRRAAERFAMEVFDDLGEASAWLHARRAAQDAAPAA